MKFNARLANNLSRVSALCALLVAGLAAAVLTSWSLGRWQLGAFGADYVPMAPSTALALLLLSSAVLLHGRWTGRAVFYYAYMVVGAVGALSVLVLLQGVAGSELSLEKWLSRSDELVGGIPVGRMSPVTALSFLLATLALLFWLPPFSRKRALEHAANLLGAGVVLMGLVIVLGYATGTPLLYGGSIIPMAWTTAVAFTLLGLALLGARADTVLRYLPDEVMLLPSRGNAHRHQWLLPGLFIVLAVAIGMTGFFYLRRQQASARQTANEQLGAIADLKAAQVADWVRERLTDAEMLYNMPILAPALQSFFADQGNRDARERLDRWINAVRVHNVYERVVVLDRLGRVRLAEPPGDDEIGPQLLSEIAVARRNRRVTLGDLQSHPSKPRLGLPVLVPMFLPADKAGREDDGFVGAIVLEANPSQYLFPAIQTWPTPSATAETLLVRRDGADVLFLNELRHRKNTALLLRRPLSDPRLPAAIGLHGERATVEGVDYRGEPVLAAMRRVPNTVWVIVAKVDQTEIYAPLRREALSVGAVVALLLLTLALGSLAIRRRELATLWQRDLALERERKAMAERIAYLTKYANDMMLFTDQDWRIVDANDRAVKAYGYSDEEFQRLTLRDLQAPESRETFDQHARELHMHNGMIVEGVHQRKDGSTFPVESSMRAVELDGQRFHQSIIRDITERKRAEDRLRLQGTALEAAANAIVMTDREGHIVWANPAFTRLTGYNAEEVLGKTPRILKSGRHDLSYYRALWETILSGHVWRGEMTNRRHDGSLYIEDQTIAPVRTEQGDITHFIAIKQDITERIQREKELRKVNRALRVLSECNHALVHASEESELLSNLCRVIVEVGGYRLAWVGFAEQDEGKTVRPVAYTGCEEGYLQSLAITWADSERGRGPTGSAIRTGKPCIANDTLTDPAFAPWRAEAAKRGYGSSIALPLRAQGQPIGALNIYAAEPDAFSSEEEVKRLTELAGDLEYGIVTLRTRAEHRRAEAALRDSEVGYRELIENANDIIYTHDMAGNFTSLNRAGVRISGYTRDEAFTMNLAQVIAPEHLDLARRMIAHKIKEGGPTAYELDLIAKDGHRIPLEVSTRLIYKDGALIGIQGIARDITERRRAEQYRAMQFGVTHILTESATFQEATRKLLQAICEGVGWELGELWRVNPTSQLLCWGGIWHAPSLNVKEFEAISRETTFSPGSGLPGRVWASGRPAWVSDVGSDRNFLRGAAAANLGLRGAFAFPFGIGNSVTGVMAFFSCEIRQPDDYLLGMMAELGVKMGQYIERKQVEVELQEINETLTAVIHASPMGITILDTDGNVKLWNPAAERIFGWRQEEILGHPLPIIPPDKQEEHRAFRERVLRNDAFAGMEVTRQKKDGSLICISLSTAALCDATGNICGVMGIMADITERKQAEATRQALYRASLEIQEPLGLQDRLDRLLQASQAILELERVNVLLADSEERWLQAVASLGTEEPLATIRVPIGPEGGAVAEAYRTRQVIVWDGGGPVPASLRLQPPYDQIAALRSRAFVVVPLVVHGRSVGVLGADRKQSRRPLDAATGEVLQLFAAQAALAIEHGRLYETQRMAAIQLEATVEARTRELQASNEQLQEATRHAQAASRHKSAFLANMSHELRTPLNAILGFSELLAQQTYGPLTQKQARYVDNVHTSGQHLLALINDLLDLSKVEAGKLELQPQAFHLREVIEVALRIFRLQTEAKQQLLHHHVADDLPALTADPLRIRQILYNLLSNAVKFTPEGGSITITAKMVSSSEFAVSSSQPETASASEFVEIAVADTGIGIKPEDLARLFQPFTQLKQTLTKSFQGTGLGLALTKHLVELHGGTIRVESAGEGLGSTFTIRLPLPSPPA